MTPGSPPYLFLPFMRSFALPYIAHWRAVLQNDKRAIFRAAPHVPLIICTDSNLLRRRPPDGGLPILHRFNAGRAVKAWIVDRQLDRIVVQIVTAVRTE